jgi:N-acetylmuramoyl-L-alanine amidase
MSDAAYLSLQSARPAVRKLSLLSISFRIFSAFVLLLAVSLPCLAQQPSTDTRKLTPERRQFERAVALRTSLESLPPDQRSLDQYKRVVDTFKKIPGMTNDAELITPSMVAIAELYAEMGRIFSESYLDNAIEAYNALLAKYPNSRYAASSLLAIGNIQEQDIKDLDKAEMTYREVMLKYPRTSKASDANTAVDRIERTRLAQREVQRETARELAERRAANEGPPTSSITPNVVDSLKESQPSSHHPTTQAEADAGLSGGEAKGPKSARLPDTEPLNPHEGGKIGGMARVTGVHPWNGENYTRIIVDLGDTVHFQAGRLVNPNRLFFDIEQATIDPKVGTKSIDVQTSIVKTIRFAQYKAGIVRLVLDLDTDKDYSAFLLQNPYRLVIDVHGLPQNQHNAALKQGPALPQPRPLLSDDQPTSGSRAAASKTVSASTTKAALTSSSANDRASDRAGDANLAPSHNTDPQPVDRLPMRSSSNSTRGVRALVPAPEPKPTRDGQTSLTRALGLKISRIVIDPGHGGHDTGTVGPHGLMEKDLCLDVALRLGKMIQEKLPGAEVVYTRKDDTFIPLEERTAIANQVKADLFISIHANSSHDQNARGVETYYLNFATSQEAMDVAARENALSQAGLHDLQDIIRKIARNDKVEESKELAEDVQDSLAHRMQQINHTERDRGVKKAPFVVLIGADMPSILSEISFLSNPADEKLLKRSDQRQRVAEGLYRGVSSYLENLNSLSYSQQKPLPPPAQVASPGNPK